MENIKPGDLFFKTGTKLLFIITKIEDNEIEITGLGGSEIFKINKEELEKDFTMFTAEAPDEVKVNFLMFKNFQLEQFITSRLK